MYFVIIEQFQVKLVGPEYPAAVEEVVYQAIEVKQDEMVHRVSVDFQVI